MWVTPAKEAGEAEHVVQTNSADTEEEMFLATEQSKDTREGIFYFFLTSL